MDQIATNSSQTSKKAEEEQAARARRLAHFDQKASDFTRRLEALRERNATDPRTLPLTADPLRLLT